MRMDEVHRRVRNLRRAELENTLLSFYNYMYADRDTENWDGGWKDVVRDQEVSGADFVDFADSILAARIHLDQETLEDDHTD